MSESLRQLWSVAGGHLLSCLLCKTESFFRSREIQIQDQKGTQEKRDPGKKGPGKKGGQRDRREEVFSETMNERVSLSVRDFLEMLPYLKIFPIPDQLKDCVRIGKQAVPHKDI